MAIQQLTQPIINPIPAFDGSKNYTVTFTVIGGAQVVGNRLVISDNETGNVIYNKSQLSMKLEHTIPAGTLGNGGYYNAVVYTIDSGSNESAASVAVPFYCYSQPTLTIDNIPTTETIENGTYTFTGSYAQIEGEQLNSYQFTLYDSNRNILSQTPLIYYVTDSSLAHTFVGMSNDTSYFVSLTGETVNGTKISSGLKYFTVRYLQPASFAICDLVNNCEDGYIQISSNIVAIDGKSNPEPPIYIDDKEVDLRDPDSWVKWNEGFRIQDDFTMRVWGRDFNPYQNIITLTNSLNSTEKPNKIELKWMVGDVLKTLPEYVNAKGQNVNLKKSEAENIKNLSIGGNSSQKAEEEINYGEGKELLIVNRDLPAEYTQVEYIQSTGGQNINTGFIPNQDTSLELGVNCYRAITSDIWFYGARKAYGNSEYSLLYRTGKLFRIDYGNRVVDFPSTLDTPTFFSIKQNKNKVTINGITTSADANNFTCPVSLYLLTVNIDGTPQTASLAAQIYYCKIYDDGKLVRDFVPCYRNSDKKPGLYDLVNDVFYTNAGATDFTYGEEITSKEVPTSKPLNFTIYGNQYQFTQDGSSTEVEGEEINLTDVDESKPADLFIKGNNYQATREGYNLVKTIGNEADNTQGLIITTNTDGEVVINGTPNTSYAAILVDKDITNVLEDGKGYTLWQTKAYSYCYLQIRAVKSDGSGNDYYTLSSNNITNFTVNKTTYSKYVLGATTGRDATTHTFNNFKIYFMLLKGTYTNDTIPTYEPYGASPSPDYPSEVKTIGQNINLYNYKDIFYKAAEYTSDDEGWITLSADRTSATSGAFYNYYTKPLNVKANTNYLVVVEVKSATGTTEAHWTSTETGSQMAGAFITSITGISKPTIYTQSVKTKTSFDGADVSLRTYCYVAAGNKISMTFRISVLEDTSITSNNFVYSNYNQGSVKVAVANKNLLNITADSVTGWNGLDITVLDNGKVKINGTAKGSVATYDFALTAYNDTAHLFPLKKNGIFSLNLYSGKVTNQQYLSVAMVKLNDDETKSHIQVRPSLSKQLDAGNYYWFRFFINKDTVFEDAVFEIQLEYGNKQTNYEPFEEQSYIMPIQQEMLTGDYIEAYNEKEVHNWKKLIFDGTESWNLDDNYQGIRQYSLIKTDIFDNERTINAYSNYFKGVIWSLSWTIDNAVVAAKTNRKVRIMTSQYTTVDEFKAFLKSKYDEGNPVIAYYKSSTPTNLDLTAEQKSIQSQLTDMTLYQGVTNITNKSSYPAIMNLNYNITRKRPSPDYPSDVQTVGGNINLLPNQETSQTINGVTFTVRDDGSIVANGTATEVANFYVAKNLKLIDGEEYTMFDWNRGGENTTYYMYINQYYNGTSHFSSSISSPVTFKFNVLSQNSNSVIISIRKGATVTNEVFYPKIEKGSIATQYSPYNQGSTTVNVQNNNFLNTNVLKLNVNDASLNGATATLNNDGSVTISDFKTAGSIRCINNYPSSFYLNPGTYYSTVGINTRNAKDAFKQFQPGIIEIDERRWVTQWFMVFSSNGTYYPQINIGSTPQEYTAFDENKVTIPIQQEMLAGDYIDWRENHNWVKVVLDDTKNIVQQSTSVANKYRYAFNVQSNIGKAVKNCSTTENKAYCDRLELIAKGATSTPRRGFTVIDNSIYIYDAGETLAEFKTKISKKPMTFYLPLVNAETIDFTDLQKQAVDKLNSSKTYIPRTYINTDEGLAILSAMTPGSPTPYNESKIYSVGEKKNLINVPDTHIEYTQAYGTPLKTNLILKPNYTYTLSFDYTINETTTDVFYSVGYGINDYEQDLAATISYENITTGRNKFTFTVPNDIPANNYLWLKLGYTIILADVNVDIKNVQLEEGSIATNYQSPDLYNIYPTVTGKNLYDYNNPLYIKQENIVYEKISGGYNIKPVNVGEPSNLILGMRNILNAGETYAISFGQLGQMEGYKLYTTDKESQEPVLEIMIDNGVFVAPEGVYDLQLVFSADSSVQTNSLEIWNIQIEANDEVTDYETYESNNSVIALDNPIRGIGNYQDIICLESPNIINPETRSAAVEGNTTYYLNQKGSTEYYIWYFNESGKLITFIDEDENISSGVIGDKGKFTTHPDCVKIVITKSNSPNADDITPEELSSNQVIISKGENEIPYYPYITNPSVIRYIGRIILNGTENWLVSGLNVPNYKGFYYYFNFGKTDTVRKCNYFSIGTAKEWSDLRQDNFVENGEGSLGIRISIGFASDLNSFKLWLKEKYDSGNPVEVYYILAAPIVEELSQDNILALQSLKTYLPMSNVFTNDDNLGDLSFDYVDAYTEQVTENAYVLLKCWNANKLPYIVHSNFIDIPKDTSKIFIWMRRKNNIFDLQIEDLGDYSEDSGTIDTMKPVVALDINQDKITTTEIPVTATSMDNNGLKNVRFSKDNGATWDETIAVDGLSSINSYVFSGLTPNTTYHIRVEAIDIAGNIGGTSQSVSTKA